MKSSELWESWKFTALSSRSRSQPVRREADRARNITSIPFISKGLRYVKYLDAFLKTAPRKIPDTPGDGTYRTYETPRSDFPDLDAEKEQTQVVEPASDVPTPKPWRSVVGPGRSNFASGGRTERQSLKTRASAGVGPSPGHSTSSAGRPDRSVVPPVQPPNPTLNPRS